MDYKAWAEWYDIFYSSADPSDIEFYKSLCIASGGPILEIGVGTGRIALPLSEYGLEVVGIDLYEPMIKAAHKRALESAPLKGKLQLIQADMRNFDLGRKFPIVTIPARTLLLATSEQEQFQTLCNAAKHLNHDGTMAFNLFYPDPDMLHDDPNKEFLLEVIDKSEGGRYVLTAKNQFDLENQINDGTQIVEEFDSEGNLLKRVELTVVVRYLYPEQITKLLDRVGLKLLEIWGDFEGGELNEQSEEIVILARHT